MVVLTRVPYSPMFFLGLDQFIADFVISGDVDARKPDPEIYKACYNERARLHNPRYSSTTAPKNLDPAESLGFRTTNFAADGNDPERAEGRVIARSFPTVWDQLDRMCRFPGESTDGGANASHSRIRKVNRV